MINDNLKQFGDNKLTVSIDDLPCGYVIFEYNGIVSEIEYVSDSYLDMLGYTRGEYEAAPKNSKGTRLCDNYYSEMSLTSFSINLTAGLPFSFEYKITKKNGAPIWIKADIKIISRENENYRLACAAMDVSNLKNPNVLGENEREIMYSIAEITSDMLFEYIIATDTMYISRKDSNGIFVFNEEIRSFEDNYRSKKLVHEDDRDIFEKMCDNMRLGVSVIKNELRIYDEQNDDFVWYKYHGKTLLDNTGKPVKVVGRIVNISENKENELKLIDKAERDPLTKIYNKASTRSLIKGYLRSDNRSTYDAFIIVDVDNFKSVNDNLGHLFGDSILVDLSQEMQDLFRTSDVVGRIGGDEFLVFLRGIKQKKHIEDKASDICRIFELLYSGENGDKITGSLGISIFPDDGDTYEELFRKADIALYTSKGQGKNCFTFYSPDKKNPLNEDNQIHANRYRKDGQIVAQNSIFNNEITDFAFDIMNKTKDVSSAINLLLSKVGKHFNLSRVCVMETAEQPFTLKCTYQWLSKDITGILGQTLSMNRRQWVSSIELYDENDIRYFNSMEDAEGELDEYTVKYYKSIGIKALLQCAVFDSGEYKGYVSFNDCNRIRVWTLDEVKALKTISKIISSYLLKMRAFEKANMMVDRLTNYDKLTGLPRFNRFKMLVQADVDNSRSGDRFALIYFDINNFKYLNEKYGSDNGDRMLKAFAELVRHINVVTKCCCRVFSDKFMAFVRIDKDYDIVQEMLARFDEFSATERLINNDSSVTVCSGVYVIDNTSNFDINIAIDNANIARKSSKRSLENACAVYNPEMKAELNNAIEILNEAERAILNHEFIVYYQPKIALKSNTVVGAEALVRWRKTDGTIVPPDKFIPYLEKNGYIVNVDFYVYEEVCKYIRRKLDMGMPIVPISLNVSRVHLRDPLFLEKVKEIVNRYKIPSHLLEFELTESVFLENQDAAVSTMSAMKDLGFIVSIDDFGAGFSSLNLLKNLPVDILKLDKEFFGNYSFHANDEIVISSIIGMASKMNISVICEGVETAEQVQFLRGTECDMVQGYFFAKPVPSDDFERYSVPEEKGEISDDGYDEIIDTISADK